jgi:hypothetical protein
MKDELERTLAPKLRFPEFKNGPGWEEMPFADLYAFKPTNTLSRDKLNFKSGTIRNIHYGDIHTRFQASSGVTSIGLSATSTRLNRSKPLKRLREQALYASGWLSSSQSPSRMSAGRRKGPCTRSVPSQAARIAPTPRADHRHLPPRRDPDCGTISPGLYLLRQCRLQSESLDALETRLNQAAFLGQARRRGAEGEMRPG